MDKHIIIKKIRDCDNCKFRPETSKVCSDYENCYMVSEYIVSLREQLKAKEQEYEELKNKFLELNGKAYSNSIELDQLKEANESLLSIQYKLADNNQRLRQTLTELKEIAEENDELLQGYHKEWANNKLILQKISEVEND